ncbi:MAG: P-II family nitrogen regulator [Chloroflexi bacterium]|nr:P-II family nitrogen regulator [Chloroflexota bacterium]
MYHMILLVLDNLEQCPDVLAAWEAAGAPGATVLESTGLARMRYSAIRDDLPLMPSITSLLKGREEYHRTLFTVVADETQVDRIIEATQTITGNLDGPDTGVLFVLPVTRAVGLRDAQKRASE